VSSRRPPYRLALTAGALGLTAVTLGLPGLGNPAHAASAACTTYASPSGSDAHSGTRTSPFRTATRLARSLRSGSVGCLAKGLYNGDVTVTASGSTLRSTPGQRATLSLGTLSVPAGATHVTVSDLNIVGNGGVLTSRLTGNYFTFTRNDITNHNRGRDQIGSCILVADSTGVTTGGVISLNKIHECGPLGSSFGHGIYTQNVHGLTIEDNLIKGVDAYAIQLYPKAYGVMVRHNVIDGGIHSVRGAIVIDGASNSHTIQQNIIAFTRVGAVQARVGTGHRAINNCYWQDPSNASGNIAVSGDITANPGFVNRAAGDYRLSSASRCRAKVGYDTAAKIAAAWAGKG
jgi:hypothetical protein